MNIIDMKNVTKEYVMGENVFEALSSVDMHVKTGEFVSIIGPSGSGKSTLLHLIGALDKPSRGKVLIERQDISKMDDEELAQLRGRKIGFVFQAFNLIPRMTALENVVLPIWFAGIGHHHEKEEKAKRALESVGLGDKLENKPSQLSGGERQRVAIARALVNEPEIIVADEPTGNLDTKTGTEIIKLLKDIHKKGNTVIVVTHDEEIAATAERKIHIIDGQIVLSRGRRKK